MSVDPNHYQNHYSLAAADSEYVSFMNDELRAFDGTLMDGLADERSWFTRFLHSLSLRFRLWWAFLKPKSRSYLLPIGEWMDEAIRLNTMSPEEREEHCTCSYVNGPESTFVGHHDFCAIRRRIPRLRDESDCTVEQMIELGSEERPPTTEQRLQFLDRVRRARAKVSTLGCQMCYPGKCSCP